MTPDDVAADILESVRDLGLGEALLQLGTKHKELARWEEDLKVQWEQLIGNDRELRHSRRLFREQLASGQPVFIECLEPPVGPHVYLLWGADDQTPLYVGQSKTVLGRISNHLQDAEKRKLTKRVQLISCQHALQMCEMEAVLISRLRPPLNRSIPALPSAYKEAKVWEFLMLAAPNLVDLERKEADAEQPISLRWVPPTSPRSPEPAL